MFLDASMMAGTAGRVWRNALIFVVPQVLLIVVITYFVMQSAVLAPDCENGPLDARSALRARRRRAPKAQPGSLLDPISSEAASLAQSLASAKASAETEARLREAADSLWTPERLRVGMQERLRGTRLIRRVEPRAVRARAPRQEHRGAGAGERPRHGARARAVRVRRHVDRARLGQRGS